MGVGRNYKDFSDIVLLEQLALNNDDAIFEEFVNRYYDDLKTECLLNCKKQKLDKHIGEEIANDTFSRVRKTKSFNRNKITNQYPRKSILAWLNRIQSNLFYDYHKSKKNRAEKVEFYLDEMINEIKPLNGNDLAIKRDIAVQIFSKLSPKQKIVVLKDAEYKRFQKYHDTDVLTELANELSVEKSSIRKIRSRAKIKIQDAINEINGSK